MDLVYEKREFWGGEDTSLGQGLASGRVDVTGMSHIRVLEGKA